MFEELLGPIISSFIGGKADSAPQVVTADQMQTRLQKLLQDPTAMTILQNLTEATNAKTAMKAGQREQYIKNKGLRNGQPKDPAMNVAQKMNTQGFLDKELAQAGRPSLDEIIKGVPTQQTVKSTAPAAPLRSVPQDTGMRMPVDDGSMNFKNFVDTLPGAKGKFTSLANPTELPKNADGNYVMNAGTRSERIVSPEEYANMTKNTPSLESLLGTGAMSDTAQPLKAPATTLPTGPVTNSGGGMSGSSGTIQNATTAQPIPTATQATSSASSTGSSTIDALLSDLMNSFTGKGKDSVLDNLVSNVFPGSETDWTEPSAYWDYGDKIQVSTDPYEAKIKEMLGGKLDNDPLMATIDKLMGELDASTKPGAAQAYNPYLDKLEKQAVDVRALGGPDFEQALYHAAADPAERAAKEAAKVRQANLASKGMMNSSVLQDYDMAAQDKLNNLLSDAGFNAKVQSTQFDQSNINQAANIYNNLANLFGQTQDDMTGNIMDKLGLATTKSEAGRQNISDMMGFLGNQDEKELTNINLKYNEFLRRLNEIKNAENQSLAAMTGQQPVQIANMNAQNAANTGAWQASQANAANMNTLAGNTAATMFGNKKQRAVTGAIPAAVSSTFGIQQALNTNPVFTGVTPTTTSWKPISTRPIGI